MCGNVSEFWFGEVRLSRSLLLGTNVLMAGLDYSASATFWIEWVRIPDYPQVKAEPGPGVREIEPFWPEGSYLQLQYSQLVILLFNGVLWPHVTVATMTLSAG